MVWLSPNMTPADDVVILGHVVANKEDLYFLSADWALWSAGDRRRHVFYFGNRAALGRNLNRLFFRWGGAGDGGRGGDHSIFRRTEGGIIRNWEPKKEIIAEELEELRRTTHIRLRAVSLFFCSPSSKTRDTKMATRVTDSARRERHVSRVFAAPARVHCSL